MGTRFRLVGLILSVVLVGVAAECASAPPEQPKKGSEASPAAQAPKPVATAALATPKTAAPRSGGTLKIGVLLDAISLDPHRASSPSTRMIYGNIHDTLTVLDFDAKLGPGLAERWEAVAPTRWRFYLRKGVKFHSGEPFNAAAVKAHFDRVLDPKRPGAALGTLKGVKTVEMVDDYTVEFITGQPTGALPMVLSAPQTSITNAAQAKKLGADYGTRPSGTGPFKFEEWKKGASITLVRNPDYWGGAPYLDKVEFRIIPEDSTRTLAYDNGEIDILYSPPGHMLAKLKADKNTTISQAVSFRTLFAGLNRKAPGLEDVRVRQALSHAIDRKAIADFVLEGIGIPA
ncbi:MAG: hypothetical protein HYU43_09340, partial [Armatimonadetes bacterium]|nr:hypothetical protein [Armatimonadota bacterium]